jgi:hypothetical protein
MKTALPVARPFAFVRGSEAQIFVAQILQREHEAQILKR